MRRIIMATVALAALACASPGRAAGPVTVKVALIDMSAASGTVSYTHLTLPTM